MPVISLDFTVTAGEATRVQACYQLQANASVNGTASQAQVLAFLKAKVRQTVVDDVKAYEKSIAVAAVPDPAPIAPT